MDTSLERGTNGSSDAASSPDQQAPERWEIDESRSRLSFALSHLVFHQVRGHFERWGGTLFLNRRQPSLSSIRVWVDLASVDTDSSERDAHLRSAEFFDVAQFPRATFESTTVEIRDGAVIMNGRLNLHGAVRDIQVTASPIAMPPKAHARPRETFSARTTFDRQAFGLHWNQDLDLGGVVVGDNVKLEAHVETIRFGDDA
ncbi:MAG: hypothetical protein JWM82_416 [Myxococcales bacterium]|nr:hypothetical protein [Myxococcales bacterium]